jgi:hypothetical protein
MYNQRKGAFFMSLLKRIELLFVEYFNRLGQMQAPDGDVTLTCPLRRLPKKIKIQKGE